MVRNSTDGSFSEFDSKKLHYYIPKSLPFFLQNTLLLNCSLNVAYSPNEDNTDPFIITQHLNSSQFPTCVYDPHLFARSSAPTVGPLSSVMHGPNLWDLSLSRAFSPFKSNLAQIYLLHKPF